MKSLERKPDARNGHVRFDERGVETKRMAGYSDTGNRKGRTQLRPAFTPPRHSSTPQTTRGAVFGEKAGWRDEGGAARGHHGATPQAFASRAKPDGLFPRAASSSPSSPREE